MFTRHPANGACVVLVPSSRPAPHRSQGKVAGTARRVGIPASPGTARRSVSLRPGARPGQGKTGPGPPAHTTPLIAMRAVPVSSQGRTRPNAALLLPPSTGFRCSRWNAFHDRNIRRVRPPVHKPTERVRLRRVSADVLVAGDAQVEEVDGVMPAALGAVFAVMDLHRLGTGAEFADAVGAFRDGPPRPQRNVTHVDVSSVKPNVFNSAR
jgi:hypothetical protein